MGTELNLDVGTLYAFLLVLSRVSGAFIFVPLPGIESGPAIARTVLSLSLTFVLLPKWPHIDAGSVNIVLLFGWLLAEAAMGIAVGLATACLTEGFQLAAQIVSLQAGYTFATTVDPTSGADSGVLIAVAQMSAGLLFFATGLDRRVLMAFAENLTSQPPGHMVSASMASALIHLAGTVFTTGFRLVLPLLGLLLMVEIALALLSRLNTSLQIMMLAFPVKMLLSLTLLAWLVSIFPKVFNQTSVQVLQIIRALMGS